MAIIASEDLGSCKDCGPLVAATAIAGGWFVTHGVVSLILYEPPEPTEPERHSGTVQLGVTPGGVMLQGTF
jgi:hypothetical protein